MARTHGPVKAPGSNDPGAFFSPVVFDRCLSGRAVLIWLCGRSHVPGYEPFNYNTGHFGAACAAAQHAGLAGALVPAGTFRNCQEKLSMRLIAWVIRVLVFVLLLVLALANTQTTTLNFLAGYSWQAPLILIGLAFFVVGLLAGLLSALPGVFRLRMENGRLKRDLRTARETPTPSAEPPLPPLI
jgi:lipopolysaccharide assembly protein A